RLECVPRQVWRCAMNRAIRSVSVLALLAFAACGGDDKVTIKVTLFAAAPDAIEVGQSSKLLFVVDPADAHVTISEVGDVTGKMEAMVAPAGVPPDFTVVGADAGKKMVTVTLKTAGLSTLVATDTASVTVHGVASVTVQPAAGMSFALSALPASATAGQSLVLTITVKDA